METTNIKPTDEKLYDLVNEIDGLHMLIKEIKEEK